MIDTDDEPQPVASVLRFFPDTEFPCYQWAEDHEGPGAQYEAYGPGTRYGGYAGHTGWYCYAGADVEDAKLGPVSEADALDWLWRNPARA